MRARVAPVGLSLSLGLCLGLGLMAGCGTTIKEIPQNRPPHPLSARPAATVEMFTAGPPERPYVEVSYLEAQQDPGSDDESEVILGKLRARAASIGCDALVVNGRNDRVIGNADSVQT